MNYESGIEPLYDVGPPYVSPRDPGEPISKPPVEAESKEDLLELIEALAVRVFVESGEWPGWFFERQGLSADFNDLPDWLKKAIHDSKKCPEESLAEAAATLVKMDKWSDLCDIIEDDLKERGYKLKEEYGNKYDNDIEFTEHISSSANSHVTISEKFDKCFESKYAYKALRPVAKVIKYLDLPEKHRQKLHEVLQSYAHPNHYSHPAGHGAGANGTAEAIIERWDIPEEVQQEIRDGAAYFGHFRTASFMHIASENQAGLEI